MTRQRVFALAALAVLVVLALWWGTRARSTADESAAHTDGASAAPVAFETNPRKRALDSARRLPAGTISGTVRDDSGAGIGGAAVCAWVRSPDLAAEDTRDPSCATTGASGSYELTNLRPGLYSLVANAPRYAGAYYRGDDDDQQVRLAAGRTLTGIDIELLSGAVEVKGVVKDIGGGPIGDAWVGLRPAGRWGVGIGLTRSGDDGTFSHWVQPGTLAVTADADGYAEARSEAVAPGQFIELFLTPESVLSGKVVEAGTDEPVPRALVEVEGDWQNGGQTSGSAFTDDDGRFVITRLSPGRYKPRAEGVGGYGLAAQSVLLGLGETRDDVIIELHPAFVVTGQLVVAGDAPTPCENGSVRLTDKAADLHHWAGTREDGHIEFKAVMPGTYDVVVRCADFQAREDYPAITIANADVLDQEWLVDAGAEITGTVRTHGGEPVPFVRVNARLSGGDPRARQGWNGDQTDDSGSYRLAGLAAGDYTLRATSADQPDPIDPVKASVATGGTARVDIVLDAGGALEGTVVDERGVAVRGAFVRAIPKQRWGSWRKNTRTNDAGAFSLSGLRPGEVRVIASRGRFFGRGALRKPGTSDDDMPGELVAIEAGTAATVRLVVESQDGVIRGRVVDGTGQPVGDAFVDYQRESDGAGAAAGAAVRALSFSFDRKPVLTQTDGTFELTGVSPGSYAVRAFRRGGGEATAEGVRPGSSVELVVRSTSSLAGTVAVKGGAPPERFRIDVTDERSGFMRQETFFRTQGRWTMTDLPAGSFHVKAEASDGSTTADVSLEAGESREGLALVLDPRATITGRVVDEDTGDPVPGFRMSASLVEGGGGWSVGGWGETDRKHVTDASGSFTVENVPAGRLYVIGFPQNRDESEYSFFRVVRVAEPGKATDVGAIEVGRRRVGNRERGGDLGIVFEQQPPGTPPEKRRYAIAKIRPDGPAADSGLEVGDVITAVDGKDVTGEHSSRYWNLARVSPGTKVELTTERGETVEVVAGEPR